MKKTAKAKIAKACMVAMAIPALVMATSGSASADDWVTWRNGKTSLYLTYGWGDYQGQVKGGLGGTGWETSWWDQANSDGSWNETTGTYDSSGLGRCLTGYYQQVYTESCNANSDQTNWWERWKEISTSTGWELKNVETGDVLDDNGSGGIYANSNDVGNSDANQRWH